jgi:hypothetical protein
MATFRKNTFIGQRIQLDGNEFDGNSFTNCVLVYGGGPLTFNNNMLNDVKWEFIDSAARTLALVSAFYQGGGYSRTFVESLLSTFASTRGIPAPPPQPAQAAT